MERGTRGGKVLGAVGLPVVGWAGLVLGPG